MKCFAVLVFYYTILDCYYCYVANFTQSLPEGEGDREAVLIERLKSNFPRYNPPSMPHQPEFYLWFSQVVEVNEKKGQWKARLFSALYTVFLQSGEYLWDDENIEEIVVPSEMFWSPNSSKSPHVEVRDPNQL